MSVISVGIDAVDINRVREMLARNGDKVLKRLLTQDEQSYCARFSDPSPQVAARIAAKEACYKALQGDNGARAVTWRDMEVVKEASGRPTIALHGRARASARKLNSARAHMSISHSRTQAVAIVILESE